MKNLSRRKFIATASTAFSFQFLPSRVWGANNRINVAGIGVGGRVREILQALPKQGPT